MLWTERFRPLTLKDIIGQDPVISVISSFSRSKNVPHLMLTGPHGTGKSSVIECFARDLYHDSWQENTTFFQTADFFLLGKTYLENDERYVHLFRKNLSLIANFKHIINWYSSLKPLDSEFKLMVFEDSHALTREAQQALRRIMERSSTTCRFIFSTQNQSAIIPAITSRCLPLLFRPIDKAQVMKYLRHILKQESKKKNHPDPDTLELIVEAAGGDLRKALLLLQIIVETGKGISSTAMVQSETLSVTSSALRSVREGDIRGGIQRLESLMIDYGLTAFEVLGELRSIIRRDYNDPRLSILLAKADYQVLGCNNEFVQLAALAHQIRGIF